MVKALITFLGAALISFTTLAQTAPTFTSTPVEDGTYGSLYTYNITTSNDTGDPRAITIASGLPAGITLTDHLDGTAVLSGTPTESGLFSFDISVSDADGTTIQTVNLDIAKAVLTATADDKAKVYGAANPLLTISYTGFVNGDGKTDITEPTISTLADETTGVSATNAITLTGGSAANYTLTLENGNLEITKAPLTATADDKAKVYGSTNPPLTITYTGFVNGDDKTDITEPTISTLADETTGVSTTNAITLTGGSAANYTLTLVPGNLEITKAALTATADDKAKVYGSTNPPLTISYTGFVNGDGKTDITEPTISTLADETTGVSAANAITLTGGSAANYTLTLENGNLEITKAPLTATADDKAKVYGEANPALTISYTGFVNGDDASAIDTAPAASTLAAISSNVGIYSIDLSGGLDNNYALSLQSGVLTITKATATVNVNNLTFTYDGTQKSATASTSPSGLNVTFTYNGSATKPVNVATYNVVGTINEMNYQGSGMGTLIINKAMALVSITNLYQNIDGSPKPVTITTTPSGLTTDITYNGSSTVPSARGSYTVEAVVNESNYEGSKTETLIINGAPATSGIANVNVLEDANNVNINLYNAFSDIEDADADLTYVVQQNTNPGLFNSTAISAGMLTLDFAQDQFGTADITIRATDVGSLFVDETFTVNVTAVQDDPAFVSTGVTGAVQDQLYQYNIVTTDPDPGDELTIAPPGGFTIPAWLTLTDNGDGTATLTGTPGSPESGNTYGIALEVKDDKVNNATQFFSINVANSNDTPYFTSTPSTSATEDIVYTYFINTDDDDTGDVLTITAPTLPLWLTLTDNGDGTGKLTGTPTNSDVGGNTVRLRVTDNSNAFVDQDFTITVDNANDVPVITSTPVVSVDEDDLYVYNITSNDPDITDDLQLKALSKPAWLTLTDNGDGAGVLTGTPTNSNVGSTSIVINVEDQDGANSNQNFTLTVNNINDKPVFTSNAVTAALQDNIYTYNISTSDPDVGDTRSIVATTLPAWLGLTDNGNGTAVLTGTPDNGDLGSNNVVLKVIDFEGLFSNQTFTINVDNANDAPVFTSTPVTTGTEDLLYTYNIATSDPDAGDTREITALSAPTWLMLTDHNNGTATLSGTPTNDNVGNFSIVLNVKDELGASDNQNFTLTISNTNDVPIFQTLPIQSAIQSIAYNYNVLVDDPDAGDNVELAATVKPSWLTFTDNGNGSGTLSGTPDNGDLGGHSVKIRASDQNGAVVFQNFNITVDNANDPPQFFSSPVTSAAEDEVYTYNITATDPDVGDDLEIESLVLPGWLVLTDFGDGTAALSGTPLNADVGISDVVLSVTDRQGVSVNQNFSIEVSNTNDPPVFSSTAVTGAIQNQVYTYNIVTSDPDLGDSRAIIAPTKPSWLTLVDNGNGTATLQGTPTNADLGANEVILQVADESDAITAQSFTINVDNINDVPAFTSSPIILATEDQPYEYSITTSDPDVGDDRTITALSLPTWLTLTDNGDGTGLLAGTPANDNVGNHTIVLNVKDAVGANVNQNFSITVSNVNDPPFFTSTPIPVAVQDIAYSYNITTGDPDAGDSRIITAATLPAWLTFADQGNGTASLTGTPINSDLGQHNVILNVEDASGTAVDQVFTINVDNANDPPSFTSTPVTSVLEDDVYSYHITTTDPDVGDIPAITALSKPAWLTLTDNEDGTALLSGVPKNADVGTINVVLNVEDGIGANVNQNFDITVINTNDAPSFTSSPVTGAIQDVQYTYNIQVNDPDNGDAATITAPTLPSWLTFTDNGNGTALLKGTPNNSNLGSNPVTLSVKDLSGAAVNQVFTINVDNQNDPPNFTSTPVTAVNEDALYTYNISTTDPDMGDTRDIIALSLPGWLALNDNGDGTGVLQGTPLNEDVGTDNVVLKVIDALEAEDDQSFSITIANTNDAPGFVSSAITVAQQDVTYTYNISTSDPDLGDNRTISVTGLPSWLVFTDHGDGTALLTGTPTNSDLGDYNLVLTVKDLNGAAIDQSFILSVKNANDPPVFTSTPATSVNEDAAYTYNITTEDPDVGDVLSITTLSKPAWLALTDHGDGSAVLTGTPLNAHVGNNEVVLNVKDVAGANVNQNFTIAVVNTNDAPVFTSTAVTSAQQDILYEYNITTADVDLADTRTISDQGLPGWLTLTDHGDGTALLSGTPSNSDLGIVGITLTVTDDATASIDQNFTITVVNANDPPSFTSTAVTSIDEDSPYTYNIATTDPDVSDVLTITALSKPSWLTLTDHNDGTAKLTGTPLNANVGDNEVVLKVEDAAGAFDNQSFTIAVANTNDPPLISSTAVTSAQQGLVYTYTIQTSDPDVGDSRSIAATTALPGWLTLTDHGNGTATLTGTPQNSDLGTSLLITIEVEDIAGATDDQSFQIEVDNSNDPPVFDSTPITEVDEDSEYIYNVQVSDPDVGDELTIKALSKPTWLTLEDNGNNTAILSGTPRNQHIGIVHISLQVKDLSNQTTEQNFDLTVINTNDAPTFISSPITSANEDAVYTYNIVTNDIDPGDAWVITAVTPGWLTLTDHEDGTATLKGTPLNEDVGTTSIQLKVEDVGGAFKTQDFDITVINTNDPPAIISVPITTIAEDDLYSYNITSSDPDDGDTPGFSANALPAWLALVDNGDGTANLTGTPKNANVGTVSIEIVIADAAGEEATQTFDLEVTNTNDAPTFTSDVVVETSEDSIYQYDVTANDVDVGDNVTIVADVLPDWLSFTDNGDGTGILKGTPLNENVGTNNVKLTVEDNHGATGDQQFDIIVINTNDAPGITSTAVTTVFEDEIYTYNITTSDVDVGDSFTITSSTLPDWLQLTDNGDGTAFLTGTPQNDDVGTINVTITVTDATGSDDAQSFSIVVINTNDKPVFESSPTLKVAIGDNYTYNVAVTDVDVGDVLTLSATLPGYLSFTDNGNGTGVVSGVIGQNARNDKDIVITADDSNGGIVNQSFTLIINNPPLVSNFSVSTDEDVTLTFTRSDFESSFQDDQGDVLASVVITKLPGKGLLTLNGEDVVVDEEISVGDLSGLTYTPDLNYFGQDAFGWKASDGISLSESAATATIEMNSVNDAPQLTTSFQNNILPDTVYSLGDPPLNILRGGDVTIRDDDGDLIQSAEIAITKDFTKGDILSLEQQAATGDVTATYDQSSGILTLEGEASAATYTELLEQVKFSSPVSVEVTSSDSMKIEITVSDATVGSNIVSRTIHITQFPELDLVNAFTPNGDGVNDKWDFDRLNSYSQVTISIYDEHGRQVFYCSDGECSDEEGNFYWDGTNNNKQLPGGPYFYTIDLDNGRRTYKGTVTILK